MRRERGSSFSRGLVLSGRGQECGPTSYCLPGFLSRVCCWIWDLGMGSVPGTVGTWVSDPWCVTS